MVKQEKTKKNASKEECTKAMECLKRINEDTRDIEPACVAGEDLDTIQEFLELAYKKLPSEKSFKGIRRIFGEKG